MACGEDNKDIVAGAKKYLAETIQDLLIKYLRDREEEDCHTLENIVEGLCDKSIDHLTMRSIGVQSTTNMSYGCIH